MCYRNHEGYRDPTAGGAMREADKIPDDVTWMCQTFRQIASLLGYEIVGRIVIRDKRTKRTWR